MEYTSAQMKSFQNDICYYKQAGSLCEVILSIGWSKIGKKALLTKITACIYLNSCRRFLDFFTEEKEFKIAQFYFKVSVSLLLLIMLDCWGLLSVGSRIKFLGLPTTFRSAGQRFSNSANQALQELK